MPKTWCWLCELNPHLYFPFNLWTNMDNVAKLLF